MNKKEKELAELLGVYSDMELEYYYNFKDLLKQGIGFSFFINYPVINPETLLASFFNQNNEHFTLINNHKVIKDVLPKIPLWDDDELELKIWDLNTKKLEAVFEIKLEDLDKRVREKVFTPQMELPIYENKYYGKITLKSESDDRKFNEMLEMTTEQMAHKVLSRVKEKFILYHMECIQTSNDLSELSLLVHRLLLWGHDHAESNYQSREFQEHLKNINFHDLGFKDVKELEILLKLMFSRLSNETFIQDVKSESKRELKLLKTRYAQYRLSQKKLKTFI